MIDKAKADIGRKNLEAIEAYSRKLTGDGELPEMSQKEVVEKVPICKLTRTFDSENMKLVVRLHDDAVAKCIASALEQLGWGRRVGRAPRSDIERKLQAILE